MATTGTMSNYLENKLINHLLRNTSYSPPSSVWLALFTVAPSETRTGTEVVESDTYSRLSIASALTVTDNYAINSSIITFPEAGEDWGTIVGVGIMDAATSGSMLFWGKMNNTVTINEGEIFSINPGMLTIKLNGSTKGGWGISTVNSILKHVLKNTNYSSPGTSVYVALGNSLTYDANYNFSGSSWTEVSTGGGTGYTRENVTSWYAPISGSTYNLSEVVFSEPPISTQWGAVTHIGIFDDSTSGNVLLWGKLFSPVYIIDGDGFKFAIGDIDITIN